MSLSATGVRTALDGLHQILIDTYCDVVSIRVVVTEERGVVADILTFHLISGPPYGPRGGLSPIIPTGRQDLIHRVALVLKDMFLQGCEAVGYGAETGTLYVSGVIACAAAVVVLTLFYAVVYIQAEECGRCVEREHTLYVVVHAELQVHEINHLLVPSLIEFLEGLECARVASLQTELFSGLRV